MLAIVAFFGASSSAQCELLSSILIPKHLWRRAARINRAQEIVRHLFVRSSARFASATLLSSEARKASSISGARAETANRSAAYLAAHLAACLAGARLSSRMTLTS